MDRREFLTGSMGAAILGSLEADSFAQDATPPPAQNWDAGQVRHLLPTVSDYKNPDQSVVRETVNRNAGPADWRLDFSRPHERHRRRLLAVPCHGSPTWAAIFFIADRRKSQGAVPALGAIDIPRP